MPGVSQPLLGLSEIGANVPRPPGVPPSVKLIDVMRADPMIRFLIKGDGNALRVKINSRALDPTGPMYPPPSPHGQGQGQGQGQGFSNVPFLDDVDYQRGPMGHSPGNSGEYRRDSIPGLGQGQGQGQGPTPGQLQMQQMERELAQQQQQFNKSPTGYPTPMRSKEQQLYGANRNLNLNNPFPQDNIRLNVQQQQQQQLGHGHYSTNDIDSMAMRRQSQSHLQLQVQQFHQQNTRLSAPTAQGQGLSPGAMPQSALPLTPAMAPSHPYRDRERERERERESLRDPRLRAGAGPGLQIPAQGQSQSQAMMKRQGEHALHIHHCPTLSRYFLPPCLQLRLCRCNHPLLSFLSFLLSSFSSFLSPFILHGDRHHSA